MAKATTTLSGAIAANDVTLKVASATGFGKGKNIKIDDEWLKQTAEAHADSTTTIPVRRGDNGTQAKAHVVTANVTVGSGSDFLGDEVTTSTTYPLSGRQRRNVSITATSSLVLQPAGTDLFVTLNGTSVIALTVPVPTKDMDGDLLFIAGNGVAAHTVTFTGGLSGGGAGYDVITVNATAPTTYMFAAVNGLWHAVVGVPMAGTVTAITGTVA